MADQKLMAEIGRAGLKVSGGQILEEFDNDIRGVKGVRIYDQMRKADPIVATGLRVINWIISQVNWHVDAGGETPQDEEAEQFLTSCMDDMSGTWTDFIHEVLSFLPFGWAYLESVYKIRNGANGDPPSSYDDGKIGYRKFVLLGQDTLYKWEFDETGGVKGMVQLLPYQQGTTPMVTIPIDKALLFRLDKEKGSPEGVSLLRPCYGPWYKKTQIEEIEAIGIERDLTGVLIIHMPVAANATDKDQAVKLLEQFKADDMTGFVAPRTGPGEENQWTFEIINSPGNKSIDTDKVVRRYEFQIMRAFLAQFLMLGSGESGSYALATSHRGMFEVALNSIVKSIEETINRFMVPPLFRLNDFGQLTALPKISAGRISKIDMDKFAEAMNKLVAAGALTPDRSLEDYIREELDLPQLPEDAQKQVKPEVTGKTQTAQKAAEYDMSLEECGADFEGAEEDIDWTCDVPYEARSVVRRIFAEPDLAPIDLLRNEIDDAGDEIDKQAQDYKDGHLEEAAFIAAMLLLLKRTERKALELGQKRVNPKAQTIDEINRQLAVEYHNRQMGFFRDFVPDMAGLSAAQLAARSRLYLQSSEGLFHTIIKTAQEKIAKATGKERYATWHTTPAEHCSVCAGWEGKSWPVSKLPTVPRGGATPCLSNCKCFLTYSDRLPKGG